MVTSWRTILKAGEFNICNGGKKENFQEVASTIEFNLMTSHVEILGTYAVSTKINFIHDNLIFRKLK